MDPLLIDSVVNNDCFKSKLIFTNTKKKTRPIYCKKLSEMKKRASNKNESVTFTPNQVCTKFKKAIQLCKKAALTVKTASGIKQFQNDKNYERWFEVFYSVLKPRESCQPELAVEP